MPRCFLAKKSPSVRCAFPFPSAASEAAAAVAFTTKSDAGFPAVVKTEVEDVDEDGTASGALCGNRSTLGSITAAQAVQSLREPVRMESVLTPSPNLDLVKAQDDNLSDDALETAPPKKRRSWRRSHKQQQARRGALRMAPFKSNFALDHADSDDDDSRLYVADASQTAIGPLLLSLEPTPPPHPPQGQTEPQNLTTTGTTGGLAPRVRTKEETDAAHDLLELSRSLPPRNPVQIATIHVPPPQTNGAYYPPTPPTPDEQHGRAGSNYATLIYISSPGPGQTSQLPYGEYHPLTPPEASSSSDRGSPSVSPVNTPCAGSAASLAIADGRTKRSREALGIVDESEFCKERSKYVCSECGKNYATSSNLSRHKQTHRSLDSGNAKKCHVCGKMYVSMPALSMHILTHNLTHACTVCGKAFSRPWLLQGHLRSHTGHKPYSCTVCNKSFADRSNLRAHMQTHSPSKNFQCSRCNKTFALKSYLNKHHESSCVRAASPALSTSSSHNAASALSSLTEAAAVLSQDASSCN